MTSANYCLIYKNNEPMFGYIGETRKNKYVVQPQRGNDLLIGEKLMEYAWKANDPPSGLSVQSFLEEQFNRVMSDTKRFELETIWELCDPDKKTYEFSELCADFLDSPDDAWAKITFFLALKQDGRFFRYKKGNFTPRAKNDLDIFDRQKSKEDGAKKKNELFEKWLRTLQSGTCPEAESEDLPLWGQFKSAIVKAASERENFNEPDTIRKWLSGHFGDTPENDLFFLNLLALIGLPVSWGKLQIMKAGVREHLPEDARTQLRDIKINGLHWDEERVADETGESAFTVDSAETGDYDDAISISRNGEGTTVRVHIADVSHLITRDSPLWKESERRLSSVYTPKCVYPMIPKTLSEKTLSLIAGEKRPVITYAWTLDDQFKVIKNRIYRSKIIVRKNLTYDALDALITSGVSAEWNACLTFSENLRAERMTNGAINITRDEVKLNIDDPEHITITPVCDDTAAHGIVEELAIAVNRFTGELMSENAQRGFYRFQEPYKILNDAIHNQAIFPETHTGKIDGSPVENAVAGNTDFQTIPSNVGDAPSVDVSHSVPNTTMTPMHHSADTTNKKTTSSPLTLDDVIIRAAKIGIEPSRHYGLGIDCYMQASSPIRRFQDLFNQYLLKKRLKGTPENPDELSLLSQAKEIEERGKEFSRLERHLVNHWKYKFLAQNIGIRLKITYRRVLKNGCTLIHFPELDLSHELLGETAITESTVIQITAVDILLHIVKFDVVSNENA